MNLKEQIQMDLKEQNTGNINQQNLLDPKFKWFNQKEKKNT